LVKNKSSLTDIRSWRNPLQSHSIGTVCIYSLNLEWLLLQVIQKMPQY
jgi:hypothetical protein